MNPSNTAFIFSSLLRGSHLGQEHPRFEIRCLSGAAENGRTSPIATRFRNRDAGLSSQPDHRGCASAAGKGKHAVRLDSEAVEHASVAVWAAGAASSTVPVGVDCEHRDEKRLTKETSQEVSA